MQEGVADGDDKMHLAVQTFFFMFPKEVSCGHTMWSILLGTGSQENAQTMEIQELHQHMKCVGKHNEHKAVLRTDPRPLWVTSLLMSCLRSNGLTSVPEK